MNWISVDDELPQYQEEVIVFCKKSWFNEGNPTITTASLVYANENVCIWDDLPSNAITYWMPFPTPPEINNDLD